MNERELTRQADALLRHLPRDPNAPHYTEVSFRCKVQTARRRDGKLFFRRRPESQLYLARKEWIAALQAAGLTCRQKEVVAFRMAGKTFEEIGAMSGCSKQAVLNVLRQAGRKIARAQEHDPYQGLAEIYKEETQRGLRTSVKGKLVR